VIRHTNDPAYIAKGGVKLLPQEREKYSAMLQINIWEDA
jgi:hypothetical protein